MKKTTFDFKKGFTVKEVIIVISILATIAIVATVVLSSMSNSVTMAREAKFVSYASQMKKKVDEVNTLGSFGKIVTPSWVCLGAYSGKAGDYCWGDDNTEIINDSSVDKAFMSVDVIPKGQMSPYKFTYTRGAIIRVNPKTIEIKFYVGDADRAKVVCPQINMIPNPDDALSCVLVKPIVKNQA